MSKLYVFGIGGTGSRVIKALCMLLASGVKVPNNFDVIVPVIIDPDTANGDLDRTTNILKKYQNITKKIGENNNFFGTKIKTLRQLTDENVEDLNNNFKFSIDGSGKKFGESIDYNGLDDENKALVDLLYTKENIAADLTVGFKGNPNIGSVVLNKIIDSKEYKEFTRSFNKGDAIFIISSIFGGTGASGFPLLLKNLRTQNPSIENSDIISASSIGAISYLPYFKVSDNNNNQKEIDSTTFFGKAKAALNYYEHAIFDNHSIDAFYHIGDNANNNEKYAEGKLEQKNKAHFVEFAGALAILDFAKHTNRQSMNSSPIIKEYGIEEASGRLKLESLGELSKNQIRLPLSKFYLLSIFLKKSLSKLKRSPGQFNDDNGILNSFYSTDFYKLDFLKFIEYFDEWMKEMSDNDISFMPFHDNQDHNSIFEFIVGYHPPKKSIFSKRLSGDTLIKEINQLVKKGQLNSEHQESKFIKIFDEVLEEQIKKILN